MDIWARGKEALLQEVANAYDAIGFKLETELDEDNTIRVRKAEWHILTDESTRCSELEKENARLAGELRVSKGTVERVEEMERDNARLRNELATALKEKQQDDVFPSQAKLHNERAASTDDQAPELPQRVEPIGAAAMISGVKYDVLARKYNVVYGQWKHHKAMHEKSDLAYAKQKEVLRQWEEAAEKSKNRAARQDIRIKQLRDEIERLKSGTVNSTEAPKDVPEHHTPSFPIILPTAKEKPWLGAVAGMALNTDLPAPTSSMIHDEVTQAVRNNANASSKHVDGPAAEREQTPDILLDLEDALGNTKRTSRQATVIHDSEEGEDEEAEKELSLPKLPRMDDDNLPRLPENLGLSEHHDSNTTDEDAGPMTTEQISQDVIIKLNSSSSPIVVSSRQVKKRKSLHEAKTQTTKVKLEIGSSSPSQQRTHSSDSIDLDDIGEKVATPRKPRRPMMALSKGQQVISQGSRSRVRSQLGVMSEQAPQEDPIRKIGTGRTSSALQPLSVNKLATPRATEKRDPKRRRIASDNEIEALSEEGLNFALQTRKDSGQEDILAHLLDKPSPLKQVLSPVRKLASTRRPRDLPAGSSLTIHRDAKSAEPDVPRLGRQYEQLRPTSASSSRGPRRSEERSRPASKESAEPRRPVLKGFSTNSNPTPRPPSRDTPKIYTTPKAALPKSRASETIFGTSEPAKDTPVQSAVRSSKSTVRRRHARTKQTEAEWEFDPEQEPLRNRPLATLGLEDFKINPAYNQGYRHAFGEVVRDKDQRQALHACTKPGCCGDKFRALAIAGRNFDIERTSADEVKDDIMMREFLGDNAHKLERMSREEKDKLWIQARTRQLAQTHGRHRHAYERPSTPPGFWQADFPTTQEEEDQRKMQKEAVRGIVQQRYEEAMRNGAYIFADE